MVTAKYNCSQDELYQACFLLATSLEEEIGKFDFKPIYGQPNYVDTYRDEVRAAPEMGWLFLFFAAKKRRLFSHG